MRPLASPARRALAAIASTLATAGVVAAQQTSPTPIAPIGTLDGHTEAVYSVGFTPDGKSVVSGGFDQSVRVWDLASRKEVRRFDGHTGLVLSVAVDKDGKQILSGGLDKTAKVWELPPSGPSKTLADHPGGIRAIALKPDGKQLAVGSGKVVKIWDLDGPKPIRELTGHAEDVESIAWRGDGNQIASGDKARTIRLWDATTGAPQGTIETPSDTVLGLAYLPDHQQILSGGSDGVARLWKLPVGEAKAELVRAFGGQKGPILALALDPGGSKLVTGSADRSIKVFEVATGKDLLTLEGHADAVKALAITKDGQRLVSGSADKTFKVWNLADGKLISTSPAMSAAVVSMALGGDGKLVVVGLADGSAKVFDPSATDPSKSERQAIPAQGGPITAVALLPDNATVLLGSEDRTVRAWPLANPGTLKSLNGHASQVYSVAWSPDASKALTGSADAGARIWDVAKGSQIRAMEKAHANVVYAVAWSPKGDVVATGGDDKLVKFWDPVEGKELRKGEGHGGAVYCLAFRPDGAQLASGSVDKTIRLWNVADGKEPKKLDGHPDDVYGLAFSPDGKKLASVGYAGNLLTWDVETGKNLTRQKVAPGVMAYAIAWSPDGKTPGHRRVGQQGLSLERSLIEPCREFPPKRPQASIVSTASKIVATPWPWPTHIDARPNREPSARIRCRSVVAILAPLAPSGWPIASAPPRVLTFSSPKPRSLRTASTCTAKASLISKLPISPRASPARARALWIAGTGPIPISEGSTPASAIDRIRAIGVSPRSRAFSSDMINRPADPTLIGELLPAVTEPPDGLKTGGSAPRESSEVSRRRH